MTYIPANLRRLVEERANFCCEYCQLPEQLSFFVHEVDHIIALKHGGTTDADNLAFACWRCNRYKGTDLGSFDPQTGAFSFLFNPRTQQWSEHFTLEDMAIVGLTPPGRTAVCLLQFNNSERLVERLRSPRRS